MKPFSCVFCFILCVCSLGLKAQKPLKAQKQPVSNQQSASSEIGNITYKTYYVRISNNVVNASLLQDTIDETGEWLEPYNGWLDVLFKNVRSGKIKVYAEKECVTPYTLNQVNEILVKHIQFHIVNEFTMQDDLVDTKFEIQWHQIQLIAFYERWSATADGKLLKEVLSYAPIFEVEDNTVEFPQLKNQLFWIKQ